MIIFNLLITYQLLAIAKTVHINISYIITVLQS